MVVPIAPSMMAMRRRRSWASGWSWCSCRASFSGLIRFVCLSQLRSEAAGLSAIPRTTCRCGFLVSRAATFTETTESPLARQQAAERARRKPRVALAVAGGHLGLPVLVEAEHDEPAPGPQHARAFGEDARRPLGIRQRVKHEDLVEGGGRKWELVRVRDLRADVPLPRQAHARGLDEAGVRVDAGERSTVGHDRRRCRAVARADVEHVPE